MATALWITLAALAVAVAIWRLRHANTKLAKILHEEATRVEPPEPDETPRHGRHRAKRLNPH